MLAENAYVIKPEDFSNEFYDAIIKWFDETGRVNGYQRIWVDEDEEYEYHMDPANEDEYVPEYQIIQDELRAKGFVYEDIILFDSSW